MTDVLSRAKALRAQMLASVQSKPKAERAARKSSAPKSKGAVTRKVNKAAAEMINDVKSIPTVLAWTPPVSFSHWLKWYKSGVDVLTSVQGHVSDWSRISWDYILEVDSSILLAQASLRKQYQQYVNALFSQPIRWSGTDGSSFGKILKREAWLELEGKHDLGLLGYSAVDRVQLAVWYAYVDRIMDWLYQTGASVTPGYVKEMGQALRDLRSDDELRAIASRAGRSRYIASGEYKSGFPRLRRQEEDASVAKAARWLELRAEFRELPIVEALAGNGHAQYKEGEPALPFEYSSFIPTVGEVYKKLPAVQRDGLRAFRNTLEGLTFDGMISDAAQRVAGYRQDLYDAGYDRAIARLDKSLHKLPLEDDFKVTLFDEKWLTRRTIASMAVKQAPASIAEANATAALELLAEGMTIGQLRDDVFADLSARAFTQLFIDAASVVDKIQKSDLFLVNWSQAVEETATAALTA